ncbi:MAG TPA: MBL fold metallo-hydrolase [Vicinamibacterales bacterium]|nr:MBL fold metallo-hydrolase [Vicinamibacterales bacterium]
MTMLPSLTFLGAAGTVTGSKYLLEVNGTRVLVDCGLFQGLKELRERNWQPLPVNPSAIHAVVLTHAHLDHCGYLPRLVSGGFRGRIFCTSGTADLCRIVLPDAAKLQEEDAEQANRNGFSKHKPALPLFTTEDAARALAMLQPLGYERPVPVSDGIEVEFLVAGHLLGSAFASLRIGGLHVLFGGDLGRYGRPVLPDPSPVREADVLLVESTYGDRTHPEDDDGMTLADIVRTTSERGGRLIVPAFAIGRVEEVLYWIRRLEAEQRIPVLPVWVDSPMAAEALVQYGRRLDELDPDMKPDQPVPRQYRAVAAFATDRLQIVSSPQQSRELVASRGAAIIVSSSGMATGGRVLHHLATALRRPENTVLFVGFQAAGTRGRQLVDGARAVRIHGADVPVEARIARLDSMSAHADASEILRWLRNFRRPPTATYVVHGEPVATAALQQRIATELGWGVSAARYLQRVTLEGAGR